MSHRILVVEDNEMSRELLCEWLKGEGYLVFSAADLRSAFTRLEKQAHDAVLLDIQLGAEDSLSLAKWIRQQPKLRHIPVIAVTASAMSGDMEHMLEAGCTAYVPKPVDFNRLRGELHRWLFPSGRSDSGNRT